MKQLPKILCVWGAGFLVVACSESNNQRLTVQSDPDVVQEKLIEEKLTGDQSLTEPEQQPVENTPADDMTEAGSTDDSAINVEDDINTSSEEGVVVEQAPVPTDDVTMAESMSKAKTTEPVVAEIAEVSEPEITPEAMTPVAEVRQPISGVWVKKSQAINGRWRIEPRSDGAYLVLGDDFKTRKAPDLKFLLSNLSVDQANNKNALDGGVLISLLKSPKGAQSYKLPENYPSFTTLLLHCEKYSKLWGAAQIK